MAAIGMADALNKKPQADGPARGIWLANTLEQVQQGLDALAVVEGPADVEIEVCCAASRPDASKVDCLVVDESHHLIAASWFEIAAEASGRVFGFSATPWMNPERDAELVAFFGGMENFLVISREEVLEGGHLANGRVVMHDIDERGEFDAIIEERAAPEILERCWKFRGLWGRQQGISVPSTWMFKGETKFEISVSAKIDHERFVRFAETQKIVQANEKRNAHAVSLAQAGILAGRSVLILIGSIEHGALIQSRVAGSVMVYSKIGAKKRREAIGDFKSGKCFCLISSSLADEGLDVPIASELILLGGGRSAAKMEQRTGRVMRPYDGKSEGVVHDYVDAGAKFAFAQARAREKTYKNLGYEINKIKC